MRERPVASQADHQLELEIGGSSTASGATRTTARKNRRRLPVIQPQAPALIATGFQPKEGLPPGGRAECRQKTGVCPWVKCEWHLARVDAENRAGRPSLSKVPRGPRGWTAAVKGDLGDERPGTTLRPIWLELERHCRAAIEVDEAGRISAINVLGDHYSPGTSGNGEAVFAGMRLHEGEALRVVSEDGAWASKAVWKQGAIVLERAPLVGQVVCVLITRVRPVSSCGLDLIEQHGKLTNEQMGDAYGRHRTLIAREVKRAVRKGAIEAERRGMSENEFADGLRLLADEWIE